MRNIAAYRQPRAPLCVGGSMEMIPLARIRKDGGTQPRAKLDYDTLEDYTDAMLAGMKFPPITVFYDGTDYWLADGFHRRDAAFAAERSEIECDVHQGTQADAQWYSFAANKTNGLRRLNEDVQRAVKAALVHPGGVGKSNRAIAKHVGVADTCVGDWRKKLEASAVVPQMGKRTVTRNGTTYEQNTANSGKPARPAPVAQQPKAPEPPVVEAAKPTPAPVPPAKDAEPAVKAVPVVEAAKPTPAPVPPVKRAEPVEIRPAYIPVQPIAPPIDREAVTAKLLRAIEDLAGHEISAYELGSRIPFRARRELAFSVGAAWEFLGFVFEEIEKTDTGAV